MAPAVLIEFAEQKGSKKSSLSKTMGKSRKYSKVNATGFVPDFRHAVDTMGESQGLGSSGRVDITELTKSEGSFAPSKKKCLSLNVANGYGSFDVPFQLLSLSKMSPSERRDLKLRLKIELDEVRKVQKKIAGMNPNPAALPPRSEGQKRPPLKSQQSTLETASVSIPHSKKRPLPSSSNNGPKTKRAVNSGRLESVESFVGVTPSYDALVKQCKSLLTRLLSHKYGKVFDKPVDIVKWNIPDYFTIIKHPMDLGTVKSKLISGAYSSLVDFAADVRLTFSNAMTYNPPTNNVHTMADALSKYFETRWKPVEKKILAIDGERPYETSIHTTRGETETADQIPPMKKMKTMPNETNVKPEPIKRIMTDEEKQKLSLELEALIAELPETIIDFLKEQSYNAEQTNDDEIEIDIDALKDDTLFKLRQLLDDYILEKRKTQAINGPCEIELANDSGFSNLSVQPPCNEPVEEEVDILGGNDPPLSSYPPVEIEIDGTNKNSKCSSSNSSSSESDSSSSDSDSSSESESDIANATPNHIKENVGCGLPLDERKGDLGNSKTGTDSVNAVGQVERSSQTNMVIDEPQSCQEGENAPSKRQVSPEKLYRAALLRNRFADTILKAREKALEKDPIKLRMEREELERQQKEEKARLQAEAKAAKEARRRAEAEAAAEAKRKRELEREAARQALQKMEKTVDINGSSQFLEHLEMLNGVQDEQLPSFAEESSPDCPQNGLGGFKLQRSRSSNPLEQLGLYMKVDDEDEEEEPPQSKAAPANDVEEGEID